MFECVCVVGATGAVGREFLELAEQRGLRAKKIRLLASARSAGQRIAINGDEHVVEELTADSFAGVDLAFFSAGGGISKTFAPRAVESGCVVVDNSSAFRMDPATPLVVPEVNPHDTEQHQGIIANPNCSTIIMVVPVWPLHRANPVRRIVVSTYQAASGAGQAAMDELTEQTRDVLAGKPAQPKLMPFQYAFNLFSHNSAIGGKRLQHRRDEDGQRDPQDVPRRRHSRGRHLRARAGDAGPQRVDQSGICQSDHARRRSGPCCAMPPG
jgi:aspartate-semialdehyde dehydrogenase